MSETTVLPLTDEQLATERDFHARLGGSWEGHPCGGCLRNWPCSTARLIVQLDQTRAALERAHITLRETLEALEYPTEDGSERAALGVRVVLGMCLTKGCSEQAAGEGEWCPSCGFEGPDEDESPATQPPPTTAHTTGEG